MASPAIDVEFDRLLQSFNAIAQYTGAKRRYALAIYAPFFGLPRAEFRKIFELWLTESQIKSQSQGNGAGFSS